MSRLDQESKSLLSSFCQLQPENEADATVHSLAGFLPTQNLQVADYAADKENANQNVHPVD